MIKHPDQRVGIFIDVQNLYYSARNLFNARVNFGEIVKSGVAGRKLIRAIAYVVSTPTGEEKPFFEALVNLGIETKVRELQIFLGGAKKADWDVGIAVDMIRLSELLDIIIIVSGDGDYVEVVEYLQNRGRQVEAMAFRETASSRLIEAVDGFTDLSAHKDLFLIGAGGMQNRASTTRRGRSNK
ncbi:MAG: hypothetical protein UX10_C0017G0010 [Candidatus Magasanikbacteria bacterium GW2011_GWA2_45_39]|uniref:NYN domain-containing protein n=2 Tax=Candidatus Magasanikiibacteriota TaxID=1752731 RepID=A0A0G1MZI4_9BACT|nr:MAG: hypothetical protein UX10_C0017G0010 [Candidatus Magasanikbacteria bacterium GW2011_GWA2_45_39]KKU13786.1 MAG: hypothetical protein UX20_C0013G0010 [Candidatus Magasanikbacteria bacterium GW2011_GWC2_45_8]HBW74294.1 hypothetical protein [Candidatus Magasanikbacteria bacterium]